MTENELAQALSAPYYLQPRPELFIEFRDMANWKDINLGRRIVPLLLCEAHPDLAPEWRKSWRTRFALGGAMYLLKCAVRGNTVALNDYYMMRWLILGHDEDMREIFRRTTLDGIVGETARWMFGSQMAHCPAFQAGVIRVQGGTLCDAKP